MGASLADGDDLEGTEGVSYVEVNRAFWTGRAPEYAESGERAWRSEPNWGVWRIPETEVGILPDVNGKDVIELGCGTAYISSWLVRRGARCTGVDITPAQLATARRLQAEHGLEFPLIEASAEEVPLPDASFDLAVSEYGASIWCDPYRWVPEAARLLRPGGELVFLVTGNLAMLTFPEGDDVPAGRELLRDYFGMYRFDWPESEDDGVEFHLPYGEWVRLLRANGLEVEALVELQAPVGAEPTELQITADWARRWPSEEIWKVRKSG